jgi:hypothetical protein
LPSFDPFADSTAVTGGTSYTVGSPLANQTNSLLGGWGSLGANFPGPEPTIVAGNLSYPGVPASTGNSVSFVPAPAMGARLDLRTNGNSGAFYYSYILKITDISAVPTTNANNAFAGFSDTVGAQPQQLARLGTRVVTKQSGAGYVLGLARNNVVADYIYDSTVRDTNEVLFIVGSYELVGGVTNVNLWINPDTNTFGTTTPPAPTLFMSNATPAAGALNGNGVRAFAILCQNATAPGGIIDELRVERSWKYVTAGDLSAPITLLIQPKPRTVVAGSRVAFSVGISGTDPVYQWFSNSVPIPGANAAAYTIAAAQLSDAAGYSVIVTNSFNSVTSSPAQLNVSATPFRLYETNVVIIRIGDGAQPLSLNGNSIFLDQFSPSGSYLNTVNIPDNGPSGMVAIGPNTVPGSITGSCLSRSADHRLLVVGAYNTNLNYGANLKDSFPADVPRGLAVINTFSQYTLSVSNSDYQGYAQVYWRGGVTDNGSNFWGAASGTAGTFYFGYSSSPDIIQNTFGNVRSIAVFNGDMYLVSAVSGNNGVMKLEGMPTAPLSPSPVPLFAGSTSSSDLDVSPDGTLIYLADDRNAPLGGIQRWQFDGSTWTNVYTLANGLPNGARYVTANFAGPNPVLYAITTDSENTSLVIIQDTGPASTGTAVASPGANQTFRGLRFGPSETAFVPRPKLGFTREGTDLILNWSGAFVLQSATNVTGMYLDVSGATSPYTNSMVSDPARFFRLRN